MRKHFRRALTLSLLTAATIPAAASADEPILPLSQVTPGMSCTAKTVFSGETPTSFPVTVRDIYRDPQYGDYLLVEVGGAAASTGIAQGMSGSPVYCPGPQGPSIAGALSYGLGWENDQVGLATPIETMLKELPSANAASAGLPKSVKAAIARQQAIPIPMVTSGLSSGVLQSLKSRSPQSKLIQSVTSGRATATKSSSVKTAATELNPGDSLGASFAMGSWTLGGIGTVSYRQGSRIWAFGHPFFDIGNSGLFMTTAPITTIVDSGPSSVFPSYKLGVVGATVGKIDNDSADSISGTLGGAPTSSTQTAVVTGRSSQRVSANIANMQAEGNPYGNINQLFAGASLTEAAYRSMGRNMVPNFSSRTCWKITVSQSEEPYRFCQQLVSRKPADIAGGSPPAWMSDLGEPEFKAVKLISDAVYADLNITSVRSDTKAFANLQAAQLKSARQVGRTRKGVAQVKVTYRNLATGAEATQQVAIRVGSQSRGRRVTLRGVTPYLPADSVFTNLPSSSEDQPSDQDSQGSVDDPKPAESEEELRSQIQDLNGVTQVKVTGLRGGSRFNRIGLDGLLPIGKASFKVK